MQKQFAFSTCIRKIACKNEPFDTNHRITPQDLPTHDTRKKIIKERCLLKLFIEVTGSEKNYAKESTINTFRSHKTTNQTGNSTVLYA